MPTPRHALELLPSLPLTGIGSLPFTEVDAALRLSFEHDIPFLPQLPAIDPGELMLASALEGLPGASFSADGKATVDLQAFRAQALAFGKATEEGLGSGGLAAFEPSARSCRSWRPFLEQLERQKRPVAKVQLVGPATARWVATTSTGAPASDAPQLDQQIFRLLMARALALVKAVRRTGATPLLFLDEPGLHALDPRNPRHPLVLQELKMLIAAARAEGAIVGLHCCSQARWGEVLELGLDVLSFDARLSLDAVLDEGPALWRFLAGGATLSLGIVPTDPGARFSVGELVDSVEVSLRSTAPASVSVEALLPRLLLTPACGLGTCSVAEAATVIAQLREAKAALASLR